MFSGTAASAGSRCYWDKVREVEKGVKRFVGKLKGENHLEDLGVDGKVILKWD
jgi:hypothetical protein